MNKNSVSLAAGLMACAGLLLVSFTSLAAETAPPAAAPAMAQVPDSGTPAGSPAAPAVPVATAAPTAPPASAVPAPEKVTELELFAMPVVVTAAKKEQSIGEAPAVMTVVTDQDIKQRGYRSLQDVLQNVPGFFMIQDNNEHIASLRGVFASTNQKFLIMRDGHRLNEWMFNNQDPDFSISLANVKRIEIIRGPGASLYGSAALCGVVNIITKDAEEVDGTQLDLGYGNFQQMKGDAVYGKKYNDKESLLAWGSVYKTDGEQENEPRGKDSAGHPIDGYAIVDKRDPSYDVGMKLKEGKFVFEGALRNSSYFQAGGNSEQLFDPNKPDLIDPQQTFLYGNLDLTWEDKIADSVTLKLDHYYDYGYWNSWQQPAMARDKAPDGQVFRWDVEDQDYGVNYSGRWDLKDGSILGGIQAEKRDFLNSTVDINYQNATNTLLPPGYPTNQNPVYLYTSPIKPGGEYYLAGYLQADYKFLDQILVNLGVRDDYYQDVGGSVNPRASVIYNPDFMKQFFWKAIYGKSFLNPSYFYRYNNGEIGYYGGPDLKPETMNSYQTELSYFFGKASSVNLTGFYNVITDVINQKTGFTAYTNFGKIAMEGVEAEINVSILDELSFFVEGTWQKPDIGNTDLPSDPKSTYQLDDNTIKNIPTEMAGAGINYMPVKFVNLNLTANWHGVIESPTAATETDFGPNYEIPQVVLLNFTLLVKEFFNTAEISLSVDNLLNTGYYLGGTMPPTQQPGRWILGTIGYKF